MQLYYPSTYRDPSLRCPVEAPNPARVVVEVKDARASYAQNEITTEAAGTPAARQALEAHRAALESYVPTIAALSKAAAALTDAQREDANCTPDDAVTARNQLTKAEARLRHARAQHEVSAATLAVARDTCAGLARNAVAQRTILNGHLKAAAAAAEGLLDAREIAALRKMAR